MGVHTGSSAVSPHRVYWRGGGDLLSLVGEGESRRDDLEAAIDDLHARLGEDALQSGRQFTRKHRPERAAIETLSGQDDEDPQP